MYIPKVWSSEVSEYQSDVSGDSYLKLKRFNLLIGPNNSGKSRLLRQLFSSPIDNLNVSLGGEFRYALESLGGIFKAVQADPNFGNFNCNGLLEIYEGECKSASSIKEHVSRFVAAVNEASDPNRSLMGSGLGSYPQVRDIATRRRPSEELENLANSAQSLSGLKRHYIPILRGMRPLGEGGDLFLERTVKDYFFNRKKENLNIVTGFNLYSLLVSNLLGQPEDRVRIRAYEKILGDEFFGGAEVTLIPEYGKDTVAVKIGEDDQFPIYNLGDGLQQVIIITSVAFLEKDFSIFFIEEPEACLHPGLLRKLAVFLLNHTQHQYISTTHSNHLLDLAETHGEVVIHRVCKVKAGSGQVFKIQECTRDRDLLNDLGVLASSVYLANSTIWVEGITDRLYLKVFMRKFLSSIEDGKMRQRYEGFLENFHYAFVEYQGGTLGHWGFDDKCTAERLSASSLCATALLIADGDITGKGDRTEILKSEMADRFHLLPCKEIENAIPLEVIHVTAKRIFDRKQSKTTEGLEVNALDRILVKSIDTSSYGIGYHLDKCLGLAGKGKNTRRVFAEESGTISDKVKFCREAVEVMSEIEWELSPHLKALCAIVFAHIAMCN